MEPSRAPFCSVASLTQSALYQKQTNKNQTRLLAENAVMETEEVSPIRTTTHYQLESLNTYTCAHQARHGASHLAAASVWLTMLRTTWTLAAEIMQTRILEMSLLMIGCESQTLRLTPSRIQMNYLPVPRQK